jgi:RND family efflux transporter MFP subunit
MFFSISARPSGPVYASRGGVGDRSRPRPGLGRSSSATAALLVALAGGTLSAADAPSSAKEPIEVTPCRIMLIQEAVLACDKAGIIAAVEVREGAVVKTGARLVQLRDDAPNAALAVARKESENLSKVVFSEKAEKVAVKEHEMGLKANERQPGSISELELEKQKLAIEKAAAEVALSKFEIELAKLRVKQAQADLDAYQVNAPFDGVVTRVHRRVGEAVRQGDPIVECIAVGVLRVEGYLPIRDVWRAGVGDAAQVFVEIPGEDLPIEKQAFSGRVVFIDLKSQPVDGGARVHVEVSNEAGRLRPGLTARMLITPKQDLAGATAPAEAR